MKDKDQSNFCCILAKGTPHTMHLQWAKTNDNISLGCIPHQNYDEKLDSSNKQTTVCQITAGMVVTGDLSLSLSLSLSHAIWKMNRKSQSFWCC